MPIWLSEEVRAQKARVQEKAEADCANDCTNMRYGRAPSKIPCIVIHMSESRVFQSQMPNIPNTLVCFIHPDRALPTRKQSHSINKAIYIIAPIRNIGTIQRNHLRGTNSIQVVNTDIAATPLDTCNAVLTRRALANI